MNGSQIWADGPWCQLPASQWKFLDSTEILHSVIFRHWNVEMFHLVRKMGRRLDSLDENFACFSSIQCYRLLTQLNGFHSGVFPPEISLENSNENIFLIVSSQRATAPSRAQRVSLLGGNLLPPLHPKRVCGYKTSGLCWFSKLSVSWGGGMTALETRRQPNKRDERECLETRQKMFRVSGTLQATSQQQKVKTDD